MRINETGLWGIWSLYQGMRLAEDRPGLECHVDIVPWSSREPLSTRQNLMMVHAGEDTGKQTVGRRKRLEQEGQCSDFKHGCL